MLLDERNYGTYSRTPHAVVHTRGAEVGKRERTETYRKEACSESETTMVDVVADCPILLEGISRVMTRSSRDLVPGREHQMSDLRSADDLPKTRVTVAGLLRPTAPDSTEILRRIGSASELICLLPPSTLKIGASLLEIQAGAICLPITAAPEKIDAAVRQRLHPPRAGTRQSTNTDDQLTFREAEVLGVVIQGIRNEEIARKLYVSTATVKAHLTSIYRKLGVKSRTQLVTIYQNP